MVIGARSVDLAVINLYAFMVGSQFMSSQIKQFNLRKATFSRTK